MKRLQNARFLYSYPKAVELSGKICFLCKIILLAFVFSGIVGCRSAKEMAKKTSESDVKQLEQLVFEHGNFEYLNSRVEFKFIPRAGVSAGMKGTLKMRRDSCLIISVQPFAGIEAVKCLVRKDSIFIVDRLHQAYAAEDFSQFKYAQYLNVELIQAILSNRIFIPGKTKPATNDFKKFEWHKNKEGNFLRWPDENFIFEFSLNEDAQYNEFRASNPETKEKIKINYSLFQEKTSGAFPCQILLSTENLEKTFQFQITYSKPSFDPQADFRFSIPSKYKKVTTSELIQRFQSML
ncbi:MAG: DUF4292 domain-containing protein [Bacteroidales bacterium]|nr:DUF4292 domain-containing protein [Bacteroidales bacterium]